MGNGGCGQFITRCLCRSFLLRGRTPHTLRLLQRRVPPMGDSPPWTAPMWILPMGCSSSQTAPVWVPSTGHCLSGTDYSSVGPPKGPQVLPGACSSVGSPQGHSLLQVHPPAPVWGPPWAAAGGYLLHCGPPWAAGAQPASSWSSAQAAEESLLWHLPLLLQWPCCLQSRLSHIFSLLSLTATAMLQFPLSPLTMLSQRCYHHHWWARPGQQQVRFDASQHWLHWTSGKLPVASHRSDPCSPPDTKTLPHKPITSCYFSTCGNLFETNACKIMQSQFIKVVFKKGKDTLLGAGCLEYLTLSLLVLVVCNSKILLIYSLCLRSKKERK